MVKHLTPELVQTKCQTSNLNAIKNLNFYGADLNDVSLLKDMPNIEICSLSLNKITTLKDFATLKKMSELYLRKNIIQELSEVKYLSQCNNLRVLWLSENPIAQHALYRKFVIKCVPNLTKLDDSNITPEERQEAMKFKITDTDIATNSSQIQTNRQQNSVSPQDRPRTTQQNRGRSPATNLGNLNTNPSQQITQLQQNQVQPQIINSSTPNGSQSNGNTTNYRNENILCAVLALLKELDENGLELVKRDIERKIQQKKQ
ncbi:UNKNOWN [Stylonychia lemnae]|uniref:Leucine Rich Repeat family protein n=1 Tax=Stylonychia lemnae TaxID=5949 RepID=A0A078AI19_STYLE|nr:UNKNOWN [Stylonychia lemnae]|eukprot:CDW81890.1 UNKNOWN [Stylonychia lemnae]